MDLLLYLISNLFHIYAVYQGSNVFFHKRRASCLYEFFAYCVYYLLNTGLYLIFHNGILNILSNLILFFLITLLYQANWMHRVLATFFIYAVGMAVDIGVTAVTQQLQTVSIFFSSGMVSSLLFLVIIRPLLHFRMLSRNISLPVQLFYMLTTLFVPIASIVVGHFIAQTLDYRSLIASMLLLAINICVFTLYDQLIRMLESQHTAELIEQQNLAYQAQLEVVQQSQFRLRCLRHDMKNHMIQMHLFLEEGNLTALREYLNNTDSFLNTGDWNAYTQNEAVNSILNYKLMPLRQAKAELNIRVQISHVPCFSVFDMNVILGNLLDNATEASAHLPEDKQKRIDLMMTEEKGVVRLRIGNRFDSTLPNSGATRKKDKANHGIGLKSVKSIVQKYHGTMKTTVNGDWYEVLLLLYENISQEEQQNTENATHNYLD